MVTFRYPIQTATWTAKVSCMLKMLDTATGEVILAERVEGEYAKSDQFVSPDAARNVPEDPLELPEDARLLEGAANAAIGKLKKALDVACSKHGQRFALQIQRAEAAGDIVGAIDSSVKYLFAYPTSNRETEKIVGVLRTYLGSEDGLVDVKTLLQTYCHVLQK
jgi:hypothetical protein